MFSVHPGWRSLYSEQRDLSIIRLPLAKVNFLRHFYSVKDNLFPYGAEKPSAQFRERLRSGAQGGLTTKK